MKCIFAGFVNILPLSGHSLPPFSAVLITGAASGIGYEFAKLAASDCLVLVLVDIDAKKLAILKQQFEQEHNIQVVVLPMDLTKPGAEEEIFWEIEKQRIPVDVLINNAGIGGFGMFAEVDWEKEEKIIRMNIGVLTRLTRLFLPGMLARKKGWVLNLASMAAFQPGPLMALYYASKAYVLSFSEAIAHELRGTGVTLTVLCPGATRTGFQQSVGSEHSRIARWGLLSDPAQVARFGYRMMKRGKTIAIPGVFNKIQLLLIRVIPRRATAYLMRKLQEFNRR